MCAFRYSMVHRSPLLPYLHLSLLLTVCGGGWWVVGAYWCSSSRAFFAKGVEGQGDKKRNHTAVHTAEVSMLVSTPPVVLRGMYIIHKQIPNSSCTLCMMHACIYDRHIIHAVKTYDILYRLYIIYIWLYDILMMDFFIVHINQSNIINQSNVTLLYSTSQLSTFRTNHMMCTTLVMNNIQLII